MSRRQGRAYIFMRWSGFNVAPGRLGEIAWAFEYMDRSGRFICFHAGGAAGSGQARSSWTTRCSTILELIKVLAGGTADRPGYDESKVFEVENADPDLALQAVQRMADEPGRFFDPLEEMRDILIRYGVRNLPLARGFSAPFLWYNILPGRSVAIRKLAVHLLQLRASSETKPEKGAEDIEEGLRLTARGVAGVLGLGECFVARVRSGLIAGIDIAVAGDMTVSESHTVARRVEEEVRAANSKIRHLFVQVVPYEAN